MSNDLKSDLLCIGGLEFILTPPVSWTGLTSQRYREFAGGSAGQESPDPIHVTLKTGFLQLEPEPGSLVEDEGGTRWFRSGSARVVDKIIPPVSETQAWRIVMDVEQSTAEVGFSQDYLDFGELDAHGMPDSAVRYPIDQHMAMHFLANRAGALIHSAGISYGGGGFMCCGVSGAGKSTISDLLDADGRFDVLSDDA